MDCIPNSSTDLYSILDVTKDATDSEIRHAYRKCCFKYHPDKNLEEDDKEEKAKMFQKVADAFSILSDPKLRQQYDIAGFEGLEEMANGSNESSTRYNSKEIFDNFFTSGENPFEEMGLYDTAEFHSRRKKEEDCDKWPKHKAEYHDLPCTLEELCLGTEKVIKVTRKRFSVEAQQLLDESKILRIQVEPGWKSGMQINMHDEGDAGEKKEPGDLIFTIKEIPHKYFQRDDANNIIYNANITLCEALTNCIVKVPTLGGKMLFVPCPEIIHHNYERRLIGEGYQLQEGHNVKGDLIIRFNVEFPKVLSMETKRQLHNLFAVTMT